MTAEDGRNHYMAGWRWAAMGRELLAGGLMDRSAEQCEAYTQGFDSGTVALRWARMAAKGTYPDVPRYRVV